MGLLYDIIMQAPDILFVGFGHNGRRNGFMVAQLPSVKIAMGLEEALTFGRKN